MGCVLCKESTGDKRKHNNPDEPPPPGDVRKTEEDLPSSSSTTIAFVSVPEVVEIGEKKKGLDSIQIQPPRTWHTGDFSAGSSRRPGMSLRTPEGWPPWLISACGDSIKDLTPRRATTYEKLEKIGQGTYSNVYKAKDLLTGKIVALKKVSLYLVFEYMEHDLSGLAATQRLKFDLPQVKCFMKQLLSGLEHCHSRGVLHRDIKELLAGKPVMPGRTEVEQLHKIFKLCGSPSDSYWKKYRLPNATLFKPQHPYKRCVAEAFNGFTPSSVHLVETLLAIDPADRGTSTSALSSEFFTTEPLPCDPSSLPKYPPSKELNVKLRDEEARRQKGLAGKGSGIDGARRIRYRGDRTGRAIPAPEANAESQANLDRWRAISQTNGKSKSEKFPPPHQDGAVGYPLEDQSKRSSIFGAKAETSLGLSRSLKSGEGTSMRKISNKDGARGASSRKYIWGLKPPPALGLSMDLLFRSRSEVFGIRR
ncbi:unnamed protein product [Arabidopsis arenosa]|uniref:Protein kinase domain-containing protein n=1 Tax=Arabidopsis arenosa TaxID=38785 RepID=A0A8S2B268_ARAAE|nr:unnamed protein product [Arabidopsis arenosa]